jgi:hypothetical protein
MLMWYSSQMPVRLVMFKLTTAKISSKNLKKIPKETKQLTRKNKKKTKNDEKTPEPEQRFIVCMFNFIFLILLKYRYNADRSIKFVLALSIAI